MRIALEPTGSIYADAMPAFLQQLHQAFRNAFSLSGPFLLDEQRAGERYGRLRFESFSDNTDRPDLIFVRGGLEAKILNAIALVRLAFDSKNPDFDRPMGEEECFQVADALFLAEAIAAEHRLALMKQEICGFDFIEDLRLSLPADGRVSSQLKDKGRTWLVDVTFDLEVQIFLKRAIDGKHTGIGAAE